MPHHPQLHASSSTSTNNSTLKGGFPCIWSFTDIYHECCPRRRQYLSQLTKHHERHQFFYCLTCFVTFDTLQEREDHKRHCSFKCVVENCPNYGKYLRQTSDDCTHAKVSSREKYSELFLMAQQKFKLNYVRDPWIFVSGEDGDGPFLEFDNEDFEIGSQTKTELPLPRKDLAQFLEGLQSMRNLMRRMKGSSSVLDEDTTLAIEHAMSGLEICNRQLRKYHRSEPPTRDIPYSDPHNASQPHQHPASFAQSLASSAAHQQMSNDATMLDLNMDAQFPASQHSFTSTNSSSALGFEENPSWTWYGKGKI